MAGRRAGPDGQEQSSKVGVAPVAALGPRGAPFKGAEWQCLKDPKCIGHT